MEGKMLFLLNSRTLNIIRLIKKKKIPVLTSILSISRMVGTKIFFGI